MATPVDRQVDAAAAFKRPDPDSILDDAGGNVDNVLGADSDDEFEDATDVAGDVDPIDSPAPAEPKNPTAAPTEPNNTTAASTENSTLSQENEQPKALEIGSLSPDARQALFNADDPDADFVPPPPSPPPAAEPVVEETLEELQERTNELQQQVGSLNSKLVQSFERQVDCEDQLMEAEALLAATTKKITLLTKERSERVAALSTGSILEKSRVSSEMQKMMDRVLEETQQRGKAESDREQIQAELEELSTSLSAEAHNMVAAERLARSRAQDKSDEMERSLNKAEAEMLEQQRVLTTLQQQIEALQRRLPGAAKAAPPPEEIKDGEPKLHITSLVRSLSEMEQKSLDVGSEQRIPELLAHEHIYLNVESFRELLNFLAHLRRQRLSLRPYYEPSADPSPSPSGEKLPGESKVLNVARHRDFPALPATADNMIQVSSQISSQPFLRRMQEEDADPCLRLDFAPGLGWLNRRSANTAILDGHLVIEPIFPGGVVPDQAAVRARAAHLPAVPCAMCGVGLVNVLVSEAQGAERKASSSWASLTGSAASLLETAGVRKSQPTHHANWSSEIESSDPESASDPSQAPSHARSQSDKGGAASATAPAPSRNRWLRLGTPSPKPDRTGSPSGLNNLLRPHGLNPTLAPTEEKKAATTMDYEPAIPTHIFRTSDTATTRYVLCPQHCLVRLRAVCAFWGWVRRLQREIVLEGKQPWEQNKPATTATAEGTPAGPPSDKVPRKESPPEESSALEAESDHADAANGTTDVEAAPPPAPKSADSAGEAGTAVDGAGPESSAASAADGTTRPAPPIPPRRPPRRPVGEQPAAAAADAAQPAQASPVARPLWRETVALGHGQAELTWEEKLFQELVSHRLSMALARTGML